MISLKFDLSNKLFYPNCIYSIRTLQLFKFHLKPDTYLFNWPRFSYIRSNILLEQTFVTISISHLFLYEQNFVHYYYFSPFLIPALFYISSNINMKSGIEDERQPKYRINNDKQVKKIVVLFYLDLNRNLKSLTENMQILGIYV